MDDSYAVGDAQISVEQLEAITHIEEVVGELPVVVQGPARRMNRDRELRPLHEEGGVRELRVVANVVEMATGVDDDVDILGPQAKTRELRLDRPLRSVLGPDHM